METAFRIVVMLGVLAAAAGIWVDTAGVMPQGKTVEWEYRCFVTERESFYSEMKSKNQLDAGPAMASLLTSKGKDGWELVGYVMNDGMNARIVCMKRPAQ